jgi:hypothetical protein
VGSDASIKRQRQEYTRCGEEGSALLIVFVFAAIVAIMLYRALPDAMFEGQRDREQLLIDRGNEYKTALKRFYIHNKTYPTSLDQLDNFNNVRYLRHHYKDPMTDKPEWRLIHIMGPGFILTDSKVKPLTNNGNPGMNGTGGGFGSSNSGGFGTSNSGGFGAGNSGGFGKSSSSGFGTSSSSAFGQSGGFANNTSPSTSTSSQDKEQASTDPNEPPEPTAAQLYGAQRRPPAAPTSATPGDPSANPDQASVDKPLPLPGVAPQPSGINPAGQMNGPGAPGVKPGSPNNPTEPGATSDPNNPAMAALNSVTAAQRRPGTGTGSGSTSTTSSQSGVTFGAGAIAGIASKAKGSSIKLMDGQSDYSKWEFVYNPQMEAAAQMQNALGNNNKGGQNNNPGGFSSMKSPTSSSNPQ